jgi:hypothetical protein
MPFPRPITSVEQLPAEAIQVYLDDLAALSARHGIVIDSGSLVPRAADVGGYLLGTHGFLYAYKAGDRVVEVFRANLDAALKQRQPRTLTADISGITAHDLIRRSRRSGEGEGA